MSDTGTVFEDETVSGGHGNSAYATGIESGEWDFLDIGDNPDFLDVFGMGAAQDAADVARNTAQQTLAENQRQFNTGFAQQQPFFQEAVPAFGMQAALSGAQGPEAQRLAFQNFQNDPGSQYLTQAGLRGIDPAVGGERLKALTQFSQGLAMQDMENRFNRLGIVSGAGQTAGAFQAGLGQNFAGQQATALQNRQSGVTDAISAGQAGTANMAGAAAGLGGAIYSANQNKGQ